MKTKQRGDLKIIKAEIATAPAELRNDNKKDFFSDPSFIRTLTDAWNQIREYNLCFID